MSEQQRPGRFQRFVSEAVDRAFLANRGYNYQTGNWSRRGAIQGGIQSGLGRINPVLGVGARLYFNWRDSVRNPSAAPLAPAGQMPFTPPTFTRTGPIPFQGTVVPDGSAGSFLRGANNASKPSGQRGRQQQTQPAIVTTPTITRGIPNMGGARGMRTWGGQGITGEAATAFMEGIHMSPGSIYTGSGGQRAY